MSRMLFLALALVLALGNATTRADEVNVWIGTTTPRNGLSQGIYHTRLDRQSGAVAQPTLAAKVGNPGFLAVHPNRQFLYSTGQSGREAAVFAFRIDGDNGILKPVNVQPIGDGGAAHLATDREGRVLLSAQYGGGSVAIYPLNVDGSIGPPQKLIKHESPSRVVAGRQDAPHPHWVGTSPDNRFVFVPDLGMDRIVIYRLDPNAVDLIPHGVGKVPPGAGPRHMKFHPNGRHIYVLNELDLSVTVFSYSPDQGVMDAIQTVPTVPEAEKAKERFVSASEIRVHPQGRFVYAANRGHDTITVFAVENASGLLTEVEREPVRGSWPRNFNLDPSGQWLLAAGRDSNTIAVFETDERTGELAYTRNMVSVPTPICVVIEDGR